MDRGAWWAAVHGVAQSRTQLKRLSMHACMYWRRKWQPTPVFLPGESQGQKSLVGCHLWGLTELGTTEVTQQQQQHAFIAYRSLRNCGKETKNSIANRLCSPKCMLLSILADQHFLLILSTEHAQPYRKEGTTHIPTAHKIKYFRFRISIWILKCVA